MFENMPPGILAIIVLALATIGGPFYSAFDERGSRRRYDIVWIVRDSPVLFRVRCTANVAAIFWLWAAWNVVTKKVPDLGIISFATVLVACGFTMKGLPSSITPKYKYGMVVSTTLVTANYLFGLLCIPSLPITLRVYLGIGAFYWALNGIWNWHGFNRQLGSGDETSSLLDDNDREQA
mmetsp:Transcript_21023/g.29678  ORF Transcript_21023/g.29678 Transcript_21023/m.29678 type:complete len:179 (+) Transcript_21023:142-678(+)